jgi:hypothetical protein
MGRAQNCADFVGNQFRLNDPQGRLPNNLDLTVIAHGAVPRLFSGGSTSEDLAGFRRVDIHAEPLRKPDPKPPPDVPPGRRQNDRWRARLLDAVVGCIGKNPLTPSPAAGGVSVEIHDLLNNVGMIFRLNGGGGCSPGTPVSYNPSSPFKTFSTDFAIHIEQFQGFANWASGGVVVAGFGPGIDLVTMLGPEACCGAGLVTVPFTGFGTTPSTAVGVGGSEIAGVMQPKTKVFAI